MTLSDKIFKDYYGNNSNNKIHINTEPFLTTKDVKEFIRELKQDLKNIYFLNEFGRKEIIEDLIDKLAGDKLI